MKGQMQTTKLKYEKSQKLAAHELPIKRGRDIAPGVLAWHLLPETGVCWGGRDLTLFICFQDLPKAQTDDDCTEQNIGHLSVGPSPKDQALLCGRQFVEVGV